MSILAEVACVWIEFFVGSKVKIKFDDESEVIGTIVSVLSPYLILKKVGQIDISEAVRIEIVS